MPEAIGSPADTALASCLYAGTVQHRRLTPFEHSFRYRLFLVYLDLSELDRVFRGRWLWSTTRFAAARFRREDHLGDPSRPLDECVRDLVQERLGRRPSGAVRLLTNLRYFGYVMNPVSFYYCFDGTTGDVDAVVAEVNNTPWGERHCYVLDWNEQADRRVLRSEEEKLFHVSPFMPMDMTYRWRLGLPGDRLSVHIANYRQGEKAFDATLLMQRRPITTGQLAAALSAHPCMTASITAAIYWQALKLWWKGATYHPHPKTYNKLSRSTTASPV